MGRLRVGVYHGDAVDTYFKILNGLQPYIENQIYLNTLYNRLFFINSKGYMHFLEFKPLKNGTYSLHEFLLTTKNTIKHLGCSKYSEREYLELLSKVIKV